MLTVFFWSHLLLVTERYLATPLVPKGGGPGDRHGTRGSAAQLEPEVVASLPQPQQRRHWNLKGIAEVAAVVHRCIPQASTPPWCGPTCPQVLMLPV